MAPFGYGPPPPPPPASSSSTGGGRHGYAQSPPAHAHQGPGRGRGGGQHGVRNRGHHSHARNDYHAASQPPYDYGSQAYAQPQYGASQQPPAHYAAPSQHQHHPAPSHWAPDQTHQTPQVHPHAPAPLSSANYHPNYAPQAYTPTQYASAPQAYGPPQPYSPAYQAVPAPTPSHPHWTGQGQPVGGNYGGNRQRGGGSYRGTHSGGPSRPDYGHEGVPHGSYGSPYAHDPRAAPYPPPPQYAYSAPPPPPNRRHDNHPPHNRKGRGGGGGAHSAGAGGGGGGGRGGRDSGAKSRSGHQHNNRQGDRVQQRQNGHNAGTKHESGPGGKKKKRKTNTLGLTPGVDDSESEDDEGEEKALADMIGADAMSVKDVEQYVAERRKNFPTRERTEARKAAEVARQEEAKAALLEKEAERLREKLRKVESSIKRKREQGDEGDEMRTASQDGSEDEKPEAMSSRAEAAPPSPDSLERKADITKHCKYYATGGSCGKQSKCRFVHDPEVREAAMKEREANDGRLTIQQRLILNDKEQEDLTILQSIHYLREKGLMSKAAAIRAKKGDAKKTPSKSPGSSLLPAASASLPPMPPKREFGSNPRRQPPTPSNTASAESPDAQGSKHYQGWPLTPYGSAKGKPTQE